MRILFLFPLLILLTSCAHSPSRTPASRLLASLKEDYMVYSLFSERTNAADTFDISEGISRWNMAFARIGTSWDIIDTSLDRLAKVDSGRAESLRKRCIELHKQFQMIDDLLVTNPVILPQHPLSDKEHDPSSSTPYAFSIRIAISRDPMQIGEFISEYKVWRPWQRLDNLNKAAAILHLAVREQMKRPTQETRFFTAYVLSNDLARMTPANYKIFMKNLSSDAYKK
jgi:hypothetical protein